MTIYRHKKTKVLYKMYRERCYCLTAEPLFDKSAKTYGGKRSANPNHFEVVATYNGVM